MGWLVIVGTGLPFLLGLALGPWLFRPSLSGPNGNRISLIIILGVGVGGTFEKSAILSKKALFRELGSPNPDPTLDALEKELLDRANRLGIGPQGYGGDTTAFGIHILTYPCHITSLPVAVTIECHAHRHKKVTL